MPEAHDRWLAPAVLTEPNQRNYIFSPQTVAGRLEDAGAPHTFPVAT